MLLAVEGGSFFSSSASGYINGLALLFLGRKNEEKPIQISPWNRYQLFEQEDEQDSRAHTRKTQASRGCASFICFGRTPESDDPSPSKTGSSHQSETSSAFLSSSDARNIITLDAPKRSDKKACLKANLKKSFRDRSVMCKCDEGHELLKELQNETSCCTVTRKVQWTDKCGKELTEIREFEVSDYAPSDAEYEGETHRRCECVIQ